MKNEEKIIKNLYAAFVVSLFMTFLPNFAAATIALVLFIGVLIAAYVLRGKSAEETLIHDHTTFIIRTIWIACLFGLFTGTASMIYMLTNLDVTGFQLCAEQNGIIQTTDPNVLYNISKICMDDYMAANYSVLITSVIIAAGPLVIYMLYRMAKGIARAAKGHRMGDNKSWF